MNPVKKQRYDSDGAEHYDSTMTLYTISKALSDSVLTISDKLRVNLGIPSEVIKTHLRYKRALSLQNVFYVEDFQACVSKAINDENLSSPKKDSYGCYVESESSMSEPVFAKFNLKPAAVQGTVAKMYRRTIDPEDLTYVYRILKSNKQGLGPCWDLAWRSVQYCPYAALIVKYWNQINWRYLELGWAVSYADIKCFCRYCKPYEKSIYAGWVRFEQMEYDQTVKKGFFQCDQLTLIRTKFLSGDNKLFRPLTLAQRPNREDAIFDTWVDGTSLEDEPFYDVYMAFEIENEGSNPENDCLASIMFYMQNSAPTPPCEASDSS